MRSKTNNYFLESQIRSSFKVNFLTKTPSFSYKEDEVIVTVEEFYKGISNLHLVIKVTFKRSEIDPMLLLKDPTERVYTVNDLYKTFGEQAVKTVQISYQLMSPSQEVLVGYDVACHCILEDGTKDPNNDANAREVLAMLLVMIAENDRTLPTRWKFLSLGGFTKQEIIEYTEQPRALNTLVFTRGYHEEQLDVPAPYALEVILGIAARENRQRFEAVAAFAAQLKLLRASTIG